MPWTQRLDNAALALKAKSMLVNRRRMGLTRAQNRIFAAVAERHHVRPTDIRSKSNLPIVVAARAEAAMLLRDELNLSYPKIGKILGKHHATIIYYCASRRRSIASFSKAVLLQWIKEKNISVRVEELKVIEARAEFTAAAAAPRPSKSQRVPSIPDRSIPA